MMPESAQEAPPLEIAHVLFMDIVAYSRLPMDRQLEAVRRLPEIVRGIPEYQEALAGEDLLSLWTGDGMALVFSATTSPTHRDMLAEFSRLSRPPLDSHYGWEFTQDRSSASRISTATPISQEKVLTWLRV